jgi:restriction system protein
MALWMVRCGKSGEREAYNLEHELVSIGWAGLPDLKTLADKQSLTALMSATNPDNKPSTITNWASQVWTFANSIQVDDLIAMPLKSTAAIAFGKIISNYEHCPELELGAQHCRKVKWLKTIPRIEINPDLLFSFGAIQTVCQISRNDAENRVRALVTGTPLSNSAAVGSAEADSVTNESITDIDYEELLIDKIRQRITQTFSGHPLAELVAAVLQAQGFHTHVSPPGADGGVDVLAGRGPHGFDGSRLAVQVKSGTSEVDTFVFRQFQGVIKKFRADHGLFVAWGGFKAPVRNEIKSEYFNIRLWDADDLIKMILENYDSLPETMKARLPLKRTWMLVANDD